MPFLILLVAVIFLPMVELSVLMQVGDVLGTFNTVALVILTAVVGVSLVKSQGLNTLMAVQRKLAQGEAPGQEIVEGMLLGVAGILLVIPGFVTDFVGVVLLTPFCRAPIAGFLYKRMQLRVVMAPQHRRPPFNSPRQRKDDVIDGEYEHKPDPSDKRPESHQLHNGDDDKRQ
ncbi:FxsA family protein [Shewanella dokdonensis]|uniref:FxsA family protein n=1 Tax=Shewanella dokdonensis TaxID=712036 RepID=A0ABX8DBD2_9GAMM|nr:FxsA family protein [Shewanella dokdonensis]MCL1075458.1 FxsA family protein [Shewanella dokdonensis]QVK22140.1 FxsA family protein [Shewanella dokdonensis]